MNKKLKELLEAKGLKEVIVYQSEPLECGFYEVHFSAKRPDEKVKKILIETIKLEEK